MNQREKAVWVAGYVHNFGALMRGVQERSQRMMTDEELAPGGEQGWIVPKAVQGADRAVRLLREYQAANDGRLHDDEDLELERQAEEDECR